MVSGTDLQAGAVYRIPSVTAGTDALITIAQTFKATVSNIDDNGSDQASFRPQIDFSLPNVGDQGYIEYRIQFVNSGGTTPVAITNFFANFNDIDGNTNYGEQLWIHNPIDYILSGSTELTVSTDGSWVLGTSGTNEIPGTGNSFSEVNYGVSYNTTSELSKRVGTIARVAGASASDRQYNIEFNCLTNYLSPETYGFDLDSDGIPNHLDLDNDNDGILDAVEAGHNRTHTNVIINGPYGSNGLTDAIETAPESGTINYTYTIPTVRIFPNFWITITMAVVMQMKPTTMPMPMAGTMNFIAREISLQQIV